ncbi:MAG: hypothetical protein FJY10_01355 [Bacteroidetes bacterium]|nr:hypothetical protein [Bacteroidota bacterium]
MGSGKINVCFIGAGAISTSLGNLLADKKDLDVRLLSIEPDVVKSISKAHFNNKYFPGIQLNPRLKASLDPEILVKADVVFIAIPSASVAMYLKEISQFIPAQAIIINLAKGFGCNKMIITDCIRQLLPNPVCSLKGPTFARDIIRGIPSGMTLASEKPEVKEIIRNLFSYTPVRLDYSEDIRGVELISILKNIYAISIGILDAHYDTPNLRYLALTRTFNEMRELLIFGGGQEQTIFRYCGFGDFTLTALNDLSRNRTLGLLIGKGFFTENISQQMVLEGKIAINIFCQEIINTAENPDKFPIMAELSKVFSPGYKMSGFLDVLVNG